VHKDVGDLRRPLKLRFFVNGDRYFRGKKMYVAPNRYHTFNDLLNDLTGKLPSNANLPYGVRQIFTPVSGRRIYDIADLVNGDTYVCAGFEGFKVIKYGRAALEPWSMARPQQTTNNEGDSEYLGNYRYRGYVTNAFHPGRYFRANHSLPQRRWPGPFGSSERGPKNTQSEGQTQKPKVITIVKYGPKPRSSIKIFLNHRSVLSYEQLMSDIAEAIGRGEGKGQRLFGVNGKEVQGISDFYRNINVFIAVGAGEANPSQDVVSDILVELFPEGNDAKNYLKDWEKSQRKNKKPAWTIDAAAKTKDSNNPKAPKVEPVHAQDKRDSGFDSSDTATNKSETDHVPPAEHKPKQKHRKKAAREVAKESAPENNNDWSADQNQNYASKLEKQRMKLINEERERVNRRMQKIIDTERRVREEERRKLEQVPTERHHPENLFTKHETSAHVSESAEVPEQSKVDDEKALLEKKQREREEREAAELAARHRMAMAERAEREKREKELLEKNKLNAQKKALETQGNKTEPSTEKMKYDTKSEMPHKDVKASVDLETANETQPNQTLQTKDVDTAEVSNSLENVPKENISSEQPAHHADAKDQTKSQQKEKRKQEKEERQQRKRAKTKIVRKTRAERQVSSDESVVQRYDFGKKLGDGNFAVVHQCKNKESGQEVAIKVIDKSKLKGKEHMVENEIDIMKDCSHHNIVRLYEEYETPERIYLIMELVKGGDLFDAITQSIKFGEADAALMVRDMGSALFYLHSRSIVHRDLKPENLLVHRNKDGSISLKLADFGLAMEVKELIYTVCGTPTYVAPEILTEIGYGLEVDMWAVGVISYILLCGFPPFRSPDRNQTELFEYIKAGDYQFISPYWDNISRSAKDLISRLLIVDRKKRYSSVDVLCHKWIVCGGQSDIVPSGAQSMDAACKEMRKELETQNKLNYENYQKLKEKKRREREKKEE
ncbi:serine/threonine-protein kinase DCLK1, partial [Biomphalaria pfeifferi]